MTKTFVYKTSEYSTLDSLHSNAMYSACLGYGSHTVVKVVELDNWKTQIRKGYLELCILGLIKKHGQIYGFDLISKLEQLGLNTKEGTLYPLLNRMADDKILRTYWQTEGNKGHPRKFYSLTELGTETLRAMNEEFKNMVALLSDI